MGFRRPVRRSGLGLTEPVGQIPRVFRILRGPSAACDKRGPRTSATGSMGRGATRARQRLGVAMQRRVTDRRRLRTVRPDGGRRRVGRVQGAVLDS
jgi:hypothetical protein